MEQKTTPPKISARHKELADRLRGDLSYKEHYAYLLDWYSSDRNGHIPAVPGAQNAQGAVNAPGMVVADGHVKKTFDDVLESLKHLDQKIERVSVAHRTGIPGKPIKVGRTKRAGNIFTRLVDGRRFERIKN